jgi:hypothetical protein
MEERERTGEKAVNVGPSNGNKFWVESGFELAIESKIPISCFQIWHGTHLKFELVFQIELKYHVPNKIFLCGTQ